MYETVIKVQNLMNLEPKGKKHVNEFELVAEAERLYRSIKIVGLANTQVSYEEDGLEKVIPAKDLPNIKRAIAAFIMILVYRWSDTNSGRLEEHYELPTKISYLLEGTKIFTNNHAGLQCITVKDFVEAFKEM